MQAFAGTSIAAIVSFFTARYLTSEPAPPPASPKQEAQPVQGTFFKPESVTPPFRRINYPHFKILYSTYHKCPLAVHEIITKELAEGDAPRSKFFFPDDHITEKHFQVDNLTYTDTQAYLRFNLNRGHMAAAGNYSSSEAEKLLTFTFANVIPQNGQNNGGIWNTFQRYSRDLAISGKCDSVQIISGPIFPKNSPFSKDSDNKQVKTFVSSLKVLKQDGAPIAEKLYKIIKCNTKHGPYIGSYQFLNQATQDNQKVLNQFEVELGNIEQQTGLKFDISGKPLRELDGSGLGKTKTEVDYPFYYGLMSKSSKIGEMNDALRRAKSQNIKIQNLNDLTDKIKDMTSKQVANIWTEGISSCQKLKKMFSLSKKLYFLKHLQQTSEIRYQKTQFLYVECKKTKDQFEALAQDFKFDIKRLEEWIETRKTD